MFIMTTFWIIAGKNFQILDQILCPKTLELKMFEIKKCNKSFSCCKYILEVSEIIYKKKQKLFILEFVFYCRRSSLLERIHRPYWNTTKTQDFWIRIAYNSSTISNDSGRETCTILQRKKLWNISVFQVIKKALHYILHYGVVLKPQKSVGWKSIA